MATLEEVQRLLEEAEREGKTNRAEFLRQKLADAGVQAPPVQPAAPPGPMAVPGEFAAAANNAILGGIDFATTTPVNNVSSLMGSDFRVPTLQGMFQENVPGAQGNFMNPGLARDAVQGAGMAAPAAMGMVPLSRNLASPVGAAMEFMGLGAARPQSMAAPGVMDAARGKDPGILQLPPPEVPRGTDLVPQGMLPQSMQPGGGAPGELVREGSEDTARFGLGYDPMTGGTRRQQGAYDSAKQGVNDGFVTMVQAANPATRGKLKQMLDSVARRRTNKRVELTERPSKVAGDALMDRVRAIRGVNRRAGREIDQVAQEQLPGAEIDVQPAMARFQQELDDIQVGQRQIRDPKTGELRPAPTFIGSDIEDVAAAERLLERVFARLGRGDAPDAYDVHRAKRYLDEHLAYGKSAEGLTGRTERVVKQLRADLNALLRDQFPDYARANTEYAETINALEKAQDLLPSKIDLDGPRADSAMGQELRKIMQNYSRGNVNMNTLQELDALAKKYAGTGGREVGQYRGILDPDYAEPNAFDDDLLTQVAFIDELNKLFKNEAPAGFQAQVAAGMVDGARQMASGNDAGMISKLWDIGYNKVRGVNEENALKALYDLVEGR